VGSRDHFVTRTPVVQPGRQTAHRTPAGGTSGIATTNQRQAANTAFSVWEQRTNRADTFQLPAAVRRDETQTLRPVVRELHVRTDGGTGALRGGAAVLDEVSAGTRPEGGLIPRLRESQARCTGSHRAPCACPRNVDQSILSVSGSKPR